MKFEDRSHQETERQQRYARSKAWNLVKIINKLKEKDKATFYSPSEEWVLPVTSKKDPEEREFVVDSGAGMHQVSRKELNSAELETMRTLMSTTTVMTAKETPAVLSLGKLCEDHGQTNHWTSGRKPHLTKMARELIAKNQTTYHS